MKFRAPFITACLALTLLTVAGQSRASEVLLDQTQFLSGQQAYVQSFSLSGPGTLTVSLTNVPWPQQLANLGVVLSSSGGLLAPVMGSGTESIKIKSGMTLFAQWFGTAQGALDTGVYSLSIKFQAAGTPVPLPASLVLLVSGLLALVWQRRVPAWGKPVSRPLTG
jgi:hypothetical protein